MASNGASMRVEDTEASLDKIKRQLASSSGRNLLQGPLYKRSDTETLRVKDEELQNLARELRARDSTIKELSEKLSETAEAAGAAASAAHTMDGQRRVAYAEKKQLKQTLEKQLETTLAKLRECEEKAVALSKEKDQLIKQRDSSVQEAHMWRTELAKARDRVVILEAAVVRGDEKVRNAETDAEAKNKEAAQRELATLQEKEDLVKYVNALQAQVQRQEMETKQVFEETESCSEMVHTPQLTKHVDSSDENVDKACLSVSEAVPVTEDGAFRLSDGNQGSVHPIGDAQWNDIQATEQTIADVREVAHEGERNSLDIPVVSSPMMDQHEQRDSIH